MTRVALTPHYEDLQTTWRACFDLAWEAACAGSLPIGAVVVDPAGSVVARGRNRLGEVVGTSPYLRGTPYLTGTPLAHAEVNALLELGQPSPGPRPVLYTSTEPCPLCMGAARMAGVGRVVFAARDPWAGCASMAERVPYLVRSGPTVDGPVSDLEGPLVALQTALHLDADARAERFLSVWEDVMPSAVAAGRRLHRDRLVAGLVAREAEPALAWETLVDAVEE